MKPTVIFSKTNRFRAELWEESEGSGKYKVHYFGPDDQDRGVKNHEASQLDAAYTVRDQLEELEIAFPIPPTVESTE